MPRFMLSPVWRSLFGLLIGFVVLAIGYQLLMSDKIDALAPFLEPVMWVIVLPVLGFMALMEMTGSAWLMDNVTMVGMLFFYPVLFALAFFFGGEGQRPRIIIAEVLLAAFVIGLGIFAAIGTDTI